jgi:hypothetical protein
MHAMAVSLGRRPTRRTTLYGEPPDVARQRRACALRAQQTA